MTFHIVRMNEKIEKIALNYQLEIDEIKEMNKYIKDWNHLIPGTKLRLPEISNILDEELDNEEPFIEEYYPKLDYSKYEYVKNEEQIDHQEQNIPLNNDYKKQNSIKQQLVLPNNHYQQQHYYYQYPYYMYQNYYRGSKRK